MNKKITMSILAICIYSMSSCSSDEKVNTQSIDKQSAYSELNENLTIYNTTFWNDNNIPQTRGFWRRLRWYLFADAGGALIGSAFGGWGALFGAVFSSATAGPVYAKYELNSKNEDLTIIDDGLLKPIKPATRNSPGQGTVINPDQQINSKINSNVTVTSSGIGYLHNKILSSINQKHPNVYKQSVGTETMAKYIVTEMEEYNYEISETEKNILIQKVNSTIPKDDTDPNVELITLLKNACPEFSDELSVLDDFANNIGGLTNSTELVKKYLDGYLKIIQNSNLTEAQKDLLKSSLEVAANSAVLWVTE